MSEHAGYVFASLDQQWYLSWSPGRSHAVASICSHQADAGRGRSTGVSQRELSGAWATCVSLAGPLEGKVAGWAADGTGSPSQCTQLAQWGRPGLLDRLLPLSEPLRRQGHSQSVHLVASQPPTSPTSLRPDRPNGPRRPDARLLVYLVPEPRGAISALAGKEAS